MVFQILAGLANFSQRRLLCLLYEMVQQNENIVTPVKKQDAMGQRSQLP
jgi:hypothetical protein